ncbi:TNF receptor associated factor 4 [Echinococcus multilocularis]|uniref:TNF receptor associated factor 4 n=1 Tax=Echinococcus multilocularis TaxID=6211 RepID=A0A068Y7B9_ECHMU|nr:TNF receptor associated factor 4 [Echinococcus multilocularis]
MASLHEANKGTPVASIPSDASESTQSCWKLPPQQEDIQRDLEKLASFINLTKRRGMGSTALAAQLLRVDDTDENSILSLSLPLGHQSGKGRCLVRNNNAQLKNKRTLTSTDLDHSSVDFECVKQGENSNTMPTAKYIRIQADCATGEPMISIFDECGQSQVACAYLAKDFKLDIDFKLWACNGNIVTPCPTVCTRQCSGMCVCCPTPAVKCTPIVKATTIKPKASLGCVPAPVCATVCAPCPPCSPVCSPPCPPPCSPPCPPPCPPVCPPCPPTCPPCPQACPPCPPCPAPCPPACPLPCPPVEQASCGNWHIWRIANFAQLEECNGGEWCEPFYLGQPGYRMQAKLEFTTYLFGIYIKLVPGDYDDCLSWPFSSDIYFSILDQTGAGNHIVRVLRPYLNDEDEREVWQRPTRMSCNQVGWGLPDIGLRSLVHSRLCRPSPYLRNGTLYIQITLGKATCVQEAL